MSRCEIVTLACDFLIHSARRPGQPGMASNRKIALFSLYQKPPHHGAKDRGQARCDFDSKSISFQEAHQRNATGKVDVQPKVTVLISTYNRPRLLGEALASVMAQELQDFEVLVRDDAGRAGEVEEVIGQFNDKRITYRRNPTNSGDWGTNVLLYSEAKGRYLAHLDDDDQWRPQFLKRLVDALDVNADCGIAFANHELIDEQGKLLPEQTQIGDAIWGRSGLTTGRHADGRRLAAVARAIPVSHSAVVRSAVLGVEQFTRGSAGRAWDMHIAALSVRSTGWLWFEAEPLSFHRWGHADQMSRLPTDDLTFTGLTWTLGALAADPVFIAERPALLRQLMKQQAKWGMHALVRQRRPGKAIRQMRKAAGSLIPLKGGT
jgi:hypothetical protein